MFIMVMELVSRMVSFKVSMGRMLYADDRAVAAESKREMQKVLVKLGLKISMEKTEHVNRHP